MPLEFDYPNNGAVSIPGRKRGVSKRTAALQEQWRRKVQKNIPSSGERLRDEAGVRCATFLKTHYGDNRAKRIARDFGCSPETAKGWLKGSLPQNKFLLMMMTIFGREFAAHLLAPCGDWASDLAVQAELDDIRERLNRVQAELDRIGAG